jgi:hypothetical protein
VDRGGMIICSRMLVIGYMNITSYYVYIQWLQISKDLRGGHQDE